MTKPQTIWEPPLGLDRLRPRDVRLTGEAIALLVLVGALLIGAVASLVLLTDVTREQNEEQRLLREEGSDAQGIVTRLWRTSEKSNPGWASYTFTSSKDGAVHEGRSRIPVRLWNSLRTGSMISIRFVPTRPEMNRPEMIERNPTPIWVAPMTAAALAATAGLLTLPLRKQRFLLVEGRPAPGRVTGLKKTDKGSIVQFEYQVLSGATRSGRSGPMRKPPGVGSNVVVIYDPNDPERHALYPLRLVKLTSERPLR